MKDDLAIRGDTEEMAKFRDRLLAWNADGWRRETSMEDRLRQMRGMPADALCFATDGTGDPPAAAVWLFSRGPGEIFVASIVPIWAHELSDEQYNQVLSLLSTGLLNPASLGLRVKIDRSPSEHALEEALSHEAREKLRSFSELANRAALDSQDLARWNAFVIQTHRDENIIDSSLLDDWLERHGWPRELRKGLIDELEAGRSLLGEYDEEMRVR